MGHLIFVLLAFTLSSLLVEGLYTVQPTWLTSNYIQAGNKNVIASYTGNNTTPKFTFLFNWNFTGVPNLGYGIKAYEGSDYLGQEKFQVNRTNLDSSSFSVAVKILGVTNIYLLNVPYIAIEPTFPHHLNSFDNVPVNYSAGQLINITNSTQSTKMYTNNINYTLQASKLTYKSFNTPLSRNKVLLFLTSLFIDGKNEVNSTPYRPINISVNSEVISTSIYRIVISFFGPSASITKMHFSILIFDEVDVTSSQKYILTYQKVNLPYTGGFIPLPSQFIGNFIMGLLDFSTNKTDTIIDFKWDFKTISGVHGVYMPQSVGQTYKNYGTQTIDRITYTLFYMKTWLCPSTPIQTFFDSSKNLCTACPIINCLDCYNISVCSLCDELNNFFINTTTMQCSLCTLPGCLDCINFTLCQICDSSSNYSLVNGLCQFCNYSQNIFLNSINNCELCRLQDCLKCQSLITCQLCNINNNYYLPLAGVTCQYCNSSLNMFINFSSSQCQVCNLTGCIMCSSLTSCITCNNMNGYYLLANYTCAFCNSSLNMFINSSGQCQACNLTGCLLCLNLVSCQICDLPNNYYSSPSNSLCSYCNNSQNMFINTSLGQCQACNLTGCIACSTLTSCKICNMSSSYFLLSNSCQSCNNSLNFFINISGQCQVCNLEGCLICTSLISCQACNSNASFYLQPLGHTCLFCNNSLDMFINTSSSQCQPCSLTGCLDCLNLTSCLFCDMNNNYSLVGSECIHCFGDNCLTQNNTNGTANGTQNNTDYNNNSRNDNNFSNSTINASEIVNNQDFYACHSQLSLCYSNFFINDHSLKVEKNGCNKFDIIFQTNQIDFLTHFQLAHFINNGIKIFNRQVNNENVQISAQYDRNINNETLQLVIPLTSFRLKIVPQQGIPLIKYDDNECKNLESIKKIVKGIQVTAYIVLLISLLSCKIVGLQLFGVLQLAYFSLAEHDFLNIYLSPLTSFKIFNGLNLPFFTQDSMALPPNIGVLNVSSSFTNNCNIMLIVLFFQLLVSLLLITVSRFKYSYKIKIWGMKLLKQGFITLIMFNIFNISFSAGIHWKYFDSSNSSNLLNAVVISLTLISVVIAIFCIQFLNENQYGEFIFKFKDNCVCRSYIAASIIYRMALGFFIALKNDYTEVTLLILAFPFIFIFFSLSNLPFIETFHNYRCNIIHFTQLLTLYTANYYRSMKLNTPMQIKGHLHTPAILQLVMIIICLVISFLGAMYEGIKKIKLACKKKKNNKQIKNQIHQNRNFTVQNVIIQGSIF